MSRSTKKTQFLEFDQNILEDQLKITKNESDEFASMLSGLDNSKPSTLVYPTPGLCIKVRTKDDKKLFLNLCKTDEVPAPEEISEAQLLKVWSEELDYRVPMSIGQLKTDVDKTGKTCMIVDIAVHSKFLTKVENHASFRSFLVHVCVEGVREKHDIESEANDFIVMKNRKAFGPLQAHRIEKRDDTKNSKKRPLIETISSDASGPIYQWQTPKYIVLKKDNIIEARIHLPGMNTNDINLQIGEDRLKVETSSSKTGGGDTKTGYRLDMHFPVNVNPSKAWSCFQSSAQLLILLIPIS